MVFEKTKLLQNINRKEAKAWKELYRYFYGALCNYAVGITSDRLVVEDIVQDALITVWKSDLVFTDFRALTVYLYRSVHNNSLKYLRDRHVACKRMLQWQADQEEVEDTNFYRAVEEELIRKLKLAITALPEQRRKILQLSIDGLSVQEIAEQLNISVNTVKTQKKRAYTYLREYLRDSYFILILLGVLEKF